MPRSNRPKKPQSQTHSRTPSKSKITYTKRQEILDDDGWTHVVDTPRRRQRASTLTKSVNGGMHTGDFEIGGVGYVNRTLEEMQKEVDFWKKGWEGEEARVALERILEGRKEEALPRETADGDESVVVEKLETAAQEGQIEMGKEDVAVGREDVAATTEEPTPSQTVDESSNPAEQDQSTEVKQDNKAQDSPASKRCKVDNIVVLGLGSLQSARREGRRATLTQLAALDTIVKHFVQTSKPLQVVLQEPQFTPLDIEYLQSQANFQVLNDPEAFAKITESSLVYAVHCYSQVYKAISEGARPAVLIGTDMSNFGKFNMSEDADTIQKQLESLIEGCEVLDFPQVRHDFSDTKIYWRTQS